LEGASEEEINQKLGMLKSEQAMDAIDNLIEKVSGVEIENQMVELEPTGANL
jgi:hypothetical protein